MSTDVPPLVCEKCEQESVYKAIKCEKCGEVFEGGAAGVADSPDKCPKCGYSKVEEGSKKTRTRRSR